jgi:thiol-disulfide isomerase/thioredoxin
MSHISTTRRSFLAGIGACGVFGRGAALAQSPFAQGNAGGYLASVWQGLDLVDADDNRFSITTGKRKLTLVKLWANWCPVCFSEIEQLDRVVSAIGPDNLDVILVSHPDWWENDQVAAKSRGVRYRLATPDRGNGRARIQAALTDANGMYAVPRSLVFRQAGEMVLAHKGALDWSDDSVVAQLKGAVV